MMRQLQKWVVNIGDRGGCLSEVRPLEGSGPYTDQPDSSHSKQWGRDKFLHQL